MYASKDAQKELLKIEVGNKEESEESGKKDDDEEAIEDADEKEGAEEEKKPSAPKQRMEFKVFVNLLSVFMPGARAEEKMKFAFRLFDVDGDQNIGSQDVRITLRCLVEDRMSEEEVEQVVEKVLREADTRGTGGISIRDFKHVMQHSDLEGKLTIEL